MGTSTEQEQPHAAGVGMAGAGAVNVSPWAVGRRRVLLRRELGLPLIILFLGVFLAVRSDYFLDWQIG